MAGTVLGACKDTEECVALREIALQHHRALLTARARARVHDRLIGEVDNAKSAALDEKRSLGLDLEEAKLGTILTARVAAMKTATATITRAVAAIDVPGETGKTENVTEWRLSFDAKTQAQAIKSAAQLMEPPPLFRFSTLLHDKERNRWTLELLRLTVDEVHVQPTPQALPTGDDPSTVPSQFGFCGASELRAEIAKAREETASLETKALKSTVLLPMIATWVGLMRRAEFADAVERESRKHFDVLAAAAMAADVPIKALGNEDGLAVLEVWGDKEARRRVAAKIPSEFSEALRQPDVSTPGVVRFTLSNRFKEPSTRVTNEPMSRRQPGGRGQPD
ncbi:MAG: hypothetical protein IPK13_03980 [Deltaproteobacteria bacterium]|nr:hypothetical protein [Deltaproteobacteria bacterium]